MCINTVFRYTAVWYYHGTYICFECIFEYDLTYIYKYKYSILTFDCHSVYS